MNDARLKEINETHYFEDAEVIDELVAALRESKAREAKLERRLKQMEENFDNECIRAGKYFDVLHSIANDKLAKEDGAYLQYQAREALKETKP